MILTKWYFLFALVVFKTIHLCHAKSNYIRRLKGSLFQRTSLSESSDELPGRTDGKLQDLTNTVNTQTDDDYPPCTYYYPMKKHKFSKYDDDWYNPCKEEESTDLPTTKPPTFVATESPSEYTSESLPQTKLPSLFYSTTPPIQLTNSNPLGDPFLEIVAVAVPVPNKVQANQPIQTPRPTIPIPQPAQMIKPNIISRPSPRPSLALSAQPTPSTNNSENLIVEEQPDISVVDEVIEEKKPSCLEAQSGQVLKTSVNFTVYYEYELLTNREADLTNVVWPAVDEAFQRFLALNLIDCDIDVTTDGASTTFTSRLESVSPEPIDSVGTQFPDGWNNDTTNDSIGTSSFSCTNIVIDEKLLNEEDLFCDVVMGSITLYLADLSYTNSASDPSILFLEYRNNVLQSLRDKINVDSEELSLYLDESLEIHSLYFISEPVDLNLSATLMIPQNVEIDNNYIESTDSSSSTPAIAASLTIFTLFVMVAVGFFIHRKRKLMDKTDKILKQIETPRMDDDDELEFFGPEEFYGLDIIDNVRGNGSAKKISKKLFPARTYDLNQSQLSDDDIPRLPSSDFATIYGLEANDTCDESSCFNYSHTTGVSIQSTTSYLKPSMVDYPDDESSVREKMSAEPRSPQEDQYTSSNSLVMKVANDVLNEVNKEENVPTTTVTSNTSTSTLDYIISLGSSVISSSPKFISASNTPKKKNEFKSMSDTKSVSKDLPIYIATQGADKSLLSIPVAVLNSTYSSDFSAHTKSPKSIVVTPRINSKVKNPSNNSCSSNSTLELGILRTQAKLSSSDTDTAGSNESARSSDHEEQDVQTLSSPSPISRSKYLMSRRKALESRFQNYRRSLSDSINNMNDSASGSWSASREFTRSISLYKNSDQSPAILGASPRPNTRVCTPSPSHKLLSRITPKISNMTDDEHITSISPGDTTTTTTSAKRVQEKRRSRPPKTPRVHNTYTSLNDIEDILDNDQEWRISPDKDDGEKKIMHAFLSERSYKKTEPVQFQADTVIL